MVNTIFIIVISIFIQFIPIFKMSILVFKNYILVSIIKKKIDSFVLYLQNSDVNLEPKWSLFKSVLCDLNSKPHIYFLKS